MQTFQLMFLIITLNSKIALNIEKNLSKMNK